MLPVHTCFALKETAVETAHGGGAHGGGGAGADDGVADRARTPPTDLDAAARLALDDDLFGGDVGPGDDFDAPDRASDDTEARPGTSAARGGGRGPGDLETQFSMLMDAVHRLEVSQRAHDAQPGDFEDGYGRETVGGRSFDKRDSQRADPSKLRAKFLARNSTVHAHRDRIDAHRSGRASLETRGPSSPHRPEGHGAHGHQSLPGYARSPSQRSLARVGSNRNLGQRQSSNRSIGFTRQASDHSIGARPNHHGALSRQSSDRSVGLRENAGSPSTRMLASTPGSPAIGTGSSSIRMISPHPGSPSI